MEKGSHCSKEHKKKLSEKLKGRENTQGRKNIPIGTRFGRLTVINKGIPLNKRRGYKVTCQCLCGKIKDIPEEYLRAGTQSCGCLQKETMSQLALPDGGSALNTLFTNYKARAKRKGISFTLSKTLFHSLVVQCCHYCGTIPLQKINNKYSGGAFIYNGIDRKNNTEGYDIENCVACCKHCNTLKRDMDYFTLKTYLTKIYNHWVIEVYPEQNMRGVRT